MSLGSASFLKIPYEFMNRINRDKLKGSNDELVMSITQQDYLLIEDASHSLDLFLMVEK